jgi:hypothetical protein
MEVQDVLGFLEYIKSLDLEIVTAVLLKIATFIGSCRIVLKPVTSFWIKKISPYIKVRPTEKLLAHPLYKSVTFFMDWLISVKAPQEKE